MTVLHGNLVTGIFLRAASAAVAFGLGLVTIVGTSSAQAQTYKENVLHSFTGGADGGVPLAGLILDAKGNFYGTAYIGGASNVGVVFKVDSKGKETVLHSFTGGADGAKPYAGLILDTKGSLYGTTYSGGASGAGVVFKMSSKGKETVLYSFTGGADGANPAYGSLILDARGGLYGTTRNGGASNAGVVFKVDSKGKETVLYSFTGGADGANPFAGLILDTKGNLYGTSWNGGASNAGVVFKVSSKGKETVLYSFNGDGDGLNPLGGLILDAKGSLYGTTWWGGDVSCVKQGGSGCGVVFKLDKAGKETVLYRFTSGADGANPGGTLILDAKGNLYGTAEWGGSTERLGCTLYRASGCGVVFKVSTKGKETVLYSFTAGSGNGDGANPSGTLILDARGNLYGTTAFGGRTGCQDGCGTVFKLVP